MSDFLTRLARRSLGEAPSIVPNLPSVFAPLNDEASAPREVATSDVQEAPQPRTAVGEHAPVLSRDRTDHPASRHADELSLVRSGDHGEHVTIPIVARNATTPQPSPRIGGRTRDEPEMPRPLLRPVLVKASQAHGEHGDVLAFSPPSPRADDGHGETGPAPLVTQPTAHKPTAGQDFSSWAGLSDPHPARGPTVHITIGRVEVRANIAPPPPAPKRRVEREAALSLGDYLKHGGGKP